MRSNIITKIVVGLIILITLISAFSMPSKAFSLQDIFNQVNDFEAAGKTEGENKISETKLQEIFIPFIRILVAIANSVLVVVAVVMGIKYMTTSSPEAQARLKTQLIGIVVATIVVFGAQGIWSLVYDFMEKTL